MKGATDLIAHYELCARGDRLGDPASPAHPHRRPPNRGPSLRSDHVDTFVGQGLCTSQLCVPEESSW